MRVVLMAACEVALRYCDWCVIRGCDPVPLP